MRNLPATAETELSIRDKSNPRSLINIVPTNVAKVIEVIPESLLCMGETELKRKANPDAFDEMLRIAFWNEYNMAQQAGRKMMMTNVYSGVCTSTLFAKTISNSFRLAYIITPPPSYSVRTEYLMNKGLEQLEQILDMPHVKNDGTPDARMADVKFKITQDLINRVRGQVVQRVEVKSQNLNVNADVSTQGHAALPQDMESINQRLEELEAKASGIDLGGHSVGEGEEAQEEIIVEDGEG